VLDASTRDTVSGMENVLGPGELEQRKRDLADLLDLMAGEITKDGGTVELGDVDYESGVVGVVLGGACGTCSLTGTTLEEGVVRILTQRLDWITAVRGTVEEAVDVIGRNGWQPKWLTSE
jgi:Fe-S cluster biogenesis protein NfuA